MDISRVATYGAFGAATLAVLGLGLVTGRGPDTAREQTVAVADTELAMPKMDNVESVGSSAALPGDLDRDALRAEIRSYLLEEPEVIMEAVRALEEKRVVEEAQADVDLVRAHAAAIFDDGFSFVGGNPEGSITLVEFQDYRCGFCKRAHGEVADLVEEDGDIRLVIKEFPILGPDSLATSELAIATLITQGSDAYKRMADALMTYAGPINDAALERLASSSFVDIEQSRAALDDPEIKARIEKTRTLGRQLNISGTPTFIIGEKIVRGFLPKDELAEVVELSRRVKQ